MEHPYEAARQAIRGLVFLLGTMAAAAASQIAALGQLQLWGYALGMPARSLGFCGLAGVQAAWVLVARGRRKDNPRRRHLRRRAAEAGSPSQRSACRRRTITSSRGGRLPRLLLSGVLIAHCRLQELSNLDEQWLEQGSSWSSEAHPSVWSGTRPEVLVLHCGATAAESSRNRGSGAPLPLSKTKSGTPSGGIS